MNGLQSSTESESANFKSRKGKITEYRDILNISSRHINKKSSEFEFI